MIPDSVRSFARSLLTGAALASAAAAQCTAEWVRGAGANGTDGDVFASVAWDPDGAGPRAEVVVLGGRFEVAGSVAARNVVAWDPVAGTFAPLAYGIGVAGNIVGALAVTPSGELIAGGSFGVGSVAPAGVARWNGTAWVPLAANAPALYGTVQALAVAPSGEIYVGGQFTVTTAAGPVGNLVRWDGAAYHGLGGTVNVAVRALALVSPQELVVAGDFQMVGTMTANGIARWHGATGLWSTYGTGFTGAQLTPPRVSAVLPLPGGELLAGGAFAAAGGVPASNVARWNGTAWSPLGVGSSGSVAAFARSSNGDVIVASGAAPASGPTVRRWNGAQWSTIGSLLDGAANALVVTSGGEVVAGGRFEAVDGIAASNLARWNGASWRALASGSDGAVWAMATLPDGSLVIGGDFSSVGGVLARNVARWDGERWEALGGGTNGRVCAVEALPDGRVLAGGSFTTAGSAPAALVASWDGTSWSPLGAGLPLGIVNDLEVLGPADVVAGGFFTFGSAAGLARWDGSAWQPFGGTNGTIEAIVRLPDGGVAVGGTFSSIAGLPIQHVARWNGTTWLPFGSGPGGSVFALAIAPDGDVVASVEGGPSFGYVRRWDGATWSQLGATNICARAIVCLPNDDIVIAGAFSVVQGVPVLGIARWHAATAAWSALGAGLNPGSNLIGACALRLGPDALLVGGAFTLVDDRPTVALARLRSSCRAAVVPYGACGAGAPRLAAIDGAWLGGTFRATATALPANALAVRVLGLAPVSVPLAGNGCPVLVSPDSLDVHVVAGGVHTFPLPIPAQAAILGRAFRTQVVAVEVSPAGAVASLTASNALAVTIGAW